MEQLRDWEQLRKALLEIADKETISRFDDYLEKGRIVHATRLLREHGVSVYD